MARRKPRLPAICVDASLIISLVTGEATQPMVDQLWQGWIAQKRRQVAPRLMPFEVAGVIQRKRRAGELTPDDARAAVLAAEKLIGVITLLDVAGGLEKIWDMAEAHNLRVFDAAYMAIAKQEKAELWTLDHDLAKHTDGNLPT